jgi:hypothetical protein
MWTISKSNWKINHEKQNIFYVRHVNCSSVNIIIVKDVVKLIFKYMNLQRGCLKGSCQSIGEQFTKTSETWFLCSISVTSMTKQMTKVTKIARCSYRNMTSVLVSNVS